MTRSAQGAQKPSHRGDRQLAASENDTNVICITAGQSASGATHDKRPSRIRTCAHGSGGGGPNHSNLCIRPAWARSLTSPAAKTIPRIFRIMELPRWPPAPCRGWRASGPGRLRPGPWFLTGVSVVVSGVKRSNLACTLAGTFPPVLVVLRAQSRLRLEGRTRTPSGPSPDLTSDLLPVGDAG
jgi:hypothetical protein